MSEEVHIKSFNKDTGDSLQEGFNSQPLIDSTSIGKSSRPSSISTSTLNYDVSRGDRTNDGDDDRGNDNVRNDRGDVK